MAHPIFWPRRSIFYPIGNTSPVCLTKDIAPDQSASVLLLGCGDPRNILYTLYASGTDKAICMSRLELLVDQAPDTCMAAAVRRMLDFTCCDIDPAVLARNYLLFTMLVDDQISLDYVWDIFYDFYLKEKPSEELVEHCHKLVDISEDMDSWRASKYGLILKFCTERTRTELRKHWTLYSRFESLPEIRKAKVKAEFLAGMDIQVDVRQTLSVARSAGPLFSDALTPTFDHFTHLWRAGIHSVNPEDLEGATHVNPTFAYSAAKEGFDVHYGIDGLSAFYLAPAFTCLKSGPLSAEDPMAAMVLVAKTQFQHWCRTFKTVTKTNDPQLVIMVFAGEALAFCNALHYYSASGTPSATPVYTMPWKSSLIVLDSGDYGDGASPVPPKTFDVIDTSNLTDHLGFLNVLVTTRPLLTVLASSTLHTEALLPLGPNAVSRFAEHFCGDVDAVCLLLDLAPSASLSKFTTTSNVHEVLAYRSFEGTQQFHERVAWKITSAADPLPGANVIHIRGD
ncbi:hypothetical protein EVG20_g5216 [Dentipellis fragilis]|uniref:DUF4470 domain-containing protein n=1 Tax=Dentipellis fragilis TaxID=205917 RepID=A0A4Y9YUL4_9AGAM|nr:hypothetical protein EVG20_g5216 [Dentipellis fragilis]